MLKVEIIALPFKYSISICYLLLFDTVARHQKYFPPPATSDCVPSVLPFKILVPTVAFKAKVATFGNLRSNKLCLCAAKNKCCYATSLCHSWVFRSFHHSAFILVCHSVTVSHVC